MKKSIKIISILLIVCLLFITSCNVIPNQANSSYVVQFIDYDGSLLKEQKVEEGKSAIPPTDPTREGYVFIGWDTEYTNVTSDLTITALYEKEIDTITYTVIFNTNSDTIIDPIIVSENQTIKEPLKPSKEGYIFEGWYLNEEKWDFENNKVTANITLTAKWTEEITLPENSSDLEFTLKENYEYEVTGLMNKSLTKLIIPEYYCGRKVTSIGDMAFYFCSSLTSIEIPNSITSIGEGAFSDCYNLTSIEIPNSVTSIGKGAFRYCFNLTIYCESLSKPSGWDTYWNRDDCPVVWGYIVEE